MANTFLNNAANVVATNNPQANVNQVSNTPNIPQNTQLMGDQVWNGQPLNNQTAKVNNSQAQISSISPITIPIQIQPQIAPAGMQQVAGTNSIGQLQTTNNIRNLQANNSNVASAPTPQAYNVANTNNNVVDFNQIYKSYQSAFGTNQDGNGQNLNNGVINGNNQTRVKKTSLGTTIITPTVANLNSVQGQYQSTYADTINSVISSMFSQLENLRNGNFYDPTKDTSLRVASEYAANSTLQSLAGSGVLNSTATAERVARIVSELIPQYEQKAYDRQVAYLSQLADMGQIVMNYDSQQFQYWKDAKDREFQAKEFEYKKQQNELENAWKRVDELGYVDNKASTILGVKVGTLSGQARLAKESQEFELKKMREQAQIEYENTKALYKIKSEIDISQNEALAKSEYELTQKYGKSTTSNTSNYSTYDEIIKNRYAEYDDFTKQYVVPDEETYNELGDYLDRLYASNAITGEELDLLSAKYSKYSGQLNLAKSESTTVNNSGLNSSNLDIWIKALDGNNKALNTLGVTINGQTKSFVNNKDAKNAVNEALYEIQEGTYRFTSNQQLMNDLKNGVFGKLGWGL